jgi:hypothetical protein
MPDHVPLTNEKHQTQYGSHLKALHITCNKNEADHALHYNMDTPPGEVKPYVSVGS